MKSTNMVKFYLRNYTNPPSDIKKSYHDTVMRLYWFAKYLIRELGISKGKWAYYGAYEGGVTYITDELYNTESISEAKTLWRATDTILKAVIEEGRYTYPVTFEYDGPEYYFNLAHVVYYTTHIEEIFGEGRSRTFMALRNKQQGFPKDQEAKVLAFFQKAISLFGCNAIGYVIVPEPESGKLYDLREQNPPLGRVTDKYNEVDWITYIPTYIKNRSNYAPDLRVEIFDKGTLLITQEKPPTYKDYSEYLRIANLQQGLFEEGLLPKL